MALVAEAVDALPEWVHEALDNVEILVDDEPPEDAETEMLGLYEGIPLTERVSDYTGVFPDRIKIAIYRIPLEEEFGDDPAVLEEEIRITVVHEIAHHFGIDDDRLEELDRY